MKKLMCGLVGIVFGFAGINCVSIINEEVNNIKYHSNKIRKIINARSGEDYQVLEFKKGEPYSVVVFGKDVTKTIVYFDLNKNGEYDFKTISEEPKKFDMKIIPPSNPRYRDYYLPKKKKKVLLFLIIDLDKKSRENLYMVDVGLFENLLGKR